MKRCVVTIAVGKPYYHKLAENLLLSFSLWNQSNGIYFLLVTDNADFYLKYKNSPKVSILPIDLDQSEKSFTSKFKLFEHVIAEENLFIDCDCLVYRDLDSVFDAFNNKNFSAIGNEITSGVFFCDVKKTINYFNITAMPRFVGSIYYFKKNSIARQIFEKAAELKNIYDELGFVRLRNKENEEPLFAVAMALNNENLIPNTGAIKADAMFYDHIKSNVIYGISKLSGPLLKVSGQEIIPSIALPAIIHYNAHFSELWVYKADVLRLHRQHYNIKLLNIFIYMRFDLVHNITNTTKKILRPFYHSIFGFRKVKKSDRID